MASLANQRAAIHAGMQASRASTIKRDLNSLEASKRKSAELKSLEQPGGRSAVRSVGQDRRQPTGNVTGGIASPLTEAVVDVGGDMVADREYYAGGFISSDGLLVLPAIKKQTFTDVNGAEVVFDFAPPGMLP
jgi:hypothetical protein